METSKKMLSQTKKPRRTATQNNALHLYFQQVADTLNEHGLDIKIILKPGLEISWSPVMVKELLWRPVQKAHLNKQSTTELDSIWDITAVYDLVNRHLSQFGISIPFPSEEELINNEETS